jgi:hypothetical protein
VPTLARLRRSILDALLDRADVMAIVGPWLVDTKRMRRPTLRTTKLVIDGYPRSANTFATVAFLYAQGHRGGFTDVPIDVANHWHRPSQLTLAARWNIPAMALIREPRAAILSSMVYAGSDDAAWFTARYLAFYRPVERIAEKLLVVDFREAISDMGAVVDRVNARFATNFTRFEHTPENVAAVQAMIEAHASRRGGHLGEGWRKEQHLSLPTPEREAMKQARERALNLPHLMPRLDAARALYERLTAPG